MCCQSFRGYVQVEPLPVRADFELLVVFLAKAIGLQKYLGHIALPKKVSPAVRVGVVVHIDGTIAAAKSQIQLLLAPQKPNFRLPLWIFVPALPIVGKLDGFRRAPIHLQ